MLLTRQTNNEFESFAMQKRVEGHVNINEIRHRYGQSSKPLPQRLLKILRLDKVYDRGEGAFLFYTNSRGEVKKVIDFLGGYGAVLLGHANPELQQEAANFFFEKRPVFAQMAVPEAATDCISAIQRVLAAEITDPYLVHLVNSGTEATEAALKHCRLNYFHQWDQFDEEWERNLARIHHHAQPAVPLQPPSLYGQQFSTLQEWEQALTHLNQSRKAENSPGFISAEKGYHGKTLGALGVTWNPGFREPFLGEVGPTFISTDPEDLEAQLKSGMYFLLLPRLNFKGEIEIREVAFNRFAGLLLEPIQGEGGIRPFPASFLQQARKLCDQYQVPLILDEIQSGTFRTGNFLASSASGVAADYYLLGKALGGGIAKVAAVLIHQNTYHESFGLLHTSTFSEDGFSSLISAKSIDLLATKADEIKQKGSQLKARLAALKTRFPGVVKEVRGSGLMLGIEFRGYRESANLGFQLLARTGYLSYVYAGFLLNKWQVRVGAPLSCPNTLRIQPPVCIEGPEMDRLIAGLEDLCRILELQDLYKLIEFTLPPEDRGLREQPADFRQAAIQRVEVPEGVTQVGFVSHFIDENTVHTSIPSLQGLNRERIEYLLDRILPISEPIILGSLLVTGATGKQVHLTLAGLCVTSGMCRNAMQNQQVEPIKELIHKAVETLAGEEKVKVVGLGQYTSILTQNGKTIPNAGVTLTSGNSYTTWLGVQALQETTLQRKQDLRTQTVAIVGAAGNIGSVYARIMVRFSGKVWLVGSPGKDGLRKTGKVVREIYLEAFRCLKARKGVPEGQLEAFLVNTQTWKQLCDQQVMVSGGQLLDALKAEPGLALPLLPAPDLSILKQCDWTVVATNAAEPFLGTAHFSPGASICDISVPTNCKPELWSNPAQLTVIPGGVAVLPNQESFPITGYPLAKGQIFGCLGETLLLGLESDRPPGSYGRIQVGQVEQMGTLARKHGFTLFIPQKPQSE